MAGYGLYGVHHENRRLHGLDVVEYVFKRCLAHYEHIVGASAYAVGPQFELRGALLAGHIEDSSRFDGKQILKHKRAFSYARLAAEQHERPLHEAAAKHPVQFLARHE